MCATKCTTIYTEYCINSGLLDAPCNDFHFFLFLVRCVWYNSKQCQMFLTKKICGGLLYCKPRYCSIWHLEALEYFWLCGNKAFSETMRCVVFFWTAPCLIIVELQVLIRWPINRSNRFSDFLRLDRLDRLSKIIKSIVSKFW